MSAAFRAVLLDGHRVALGWILKNRQALFKVTLAFSKMVAYKDQLSSHYRSQLVIQVQKQE